MFDLEHSIEHWRQQMLAAGIQSPALDELENHLREEIERQGKSGLSERIAFAEAAKQVGQPDELKSEFKKIERNFMKKTIIIAAGILGILVGPAVFLPALAKYRHEGVWSSEVIVPILIGVVVTLAGAITVIYGFKWRKVLE